MNSSDLLEQNSGLSNDNSNGNLPNATAVLVLGIISIVICVFGFITAIIALVLHRKDKAIYLSNPTKYAASYKNSKAGNICAIIGLSLSVFMIIFYVIYFIFLFAVISNIR